LSESSAVVTISDAQYARARSRSLNVYAAVAVLSILGILGLIGYSVRLGPLVGPGIESSFGFALALMFLFTALLFHVVDRIYRVWPGGRRVWAPVPTAITDLSVVRLLRILVILAAAAAIAFVISTLVTG
jgi:hypothetical protein